MKWNWKWDLAYVIFYGTIVGGLILLLGACSRPSYDWGGLAKGLEQVKSGNKQ